MISGQAKTAEVGTSAVFDNVASDAAAPKVLLWASSNIQHAL